MLDIKTVQLRNEEEIIASWNDKEKIVVSVICAAYNHELYIEDAITGFLMQETDFAFEVIIHDDASTDKTASIIKHYQELYPNIIKPIYQTENQYSKGNFRIVPFAEKVAKGKYIARCEGDDYWLDKHKLKIQVAFLDKHSEYIITYTDAVSIDSLGQDLKLVSGGAKKDLSSIELKCAHPINTLTSCYRNIDLEFPYEFEVTPIADLFYWSLLGEYGKGKYLNEIKPSAYRHHSGGILSLQPNEAKFRMSLLTTVLMFSYYSRINDFELSEHFKKQSMIFFKNEIIIYFKSSLKKKVFSPRFWCWALFGLLKVFANVLLNICKKS